MEPKWTQKNSQSIRRGIECGKSLKIDATNGVRAKLQSVELNIAWQHDTKFILINLWCSVINVLVTKCLHTTHCRLYHLAEIDWQPAKKESLESSYLLLKSNAKHAWIIIHRQTRAILFRPKESKRKKINREICLQWTHFFFFFFAMLVCANPLCSNIPCLQY